MDDLSRIDSGQTRLDASLQIQHLGWVAAVRALTWTLIVVWALSSLWYPFGWDQGIMAWVGATILDGGMPYRDAFDIKGPAAHYIFALAQALFGHNLWGIRVMDLAGLGAAAWLIAAVADRAAAARVGSWAAALFILWFAGLTFWHTAQPDGFAAMLLCLGLLPLFRGDAPVDLPRTVAAGLAIGATVAIKPHYIAFLAVPAVLLGIRSHWRIRVLAFPVAVMTVAALSVVAIVLGWFAYRGALDALLDAHLIYNAQAYTSGASLAIVERLRGLAAYALGGQLFVVLLPAALFGAIRLLQRDRAAMWALTTWAAVAIAGVVLQNKFFAYQWAPLFPPIVILAIVGLHEGFTSGARQFARVLGLVVLVHACAHPAVEVANWASYMTGARDTAGYYDTFGVPGPDYRMSEYIKAHSASTDRLIVMGWNIEVLYMTDRPTVSRLAYSLPVWMGEGTALRQRYRDELMRDLVRDPPELIVVAPQAEPLLGRSVSLAEFPEFDRFLTARYVVEHDEDVLRLYRRR